MHGSDAISGGYYLFPRCHLCLGFQPKSAQIGKQMPKNLKLVSRGKAIRTATMTEG